jgi:hypothetical protein
MRALCGAIIAAGAVIGLGLTALGIGTRYQNASPLRDAAGNIITDPFLVHISSMDRPLVFCLVFLTCVAIIGLGIAFVGLAYHHHRRYHELVAAGHLPPHHHHHAARTAATPADTGIQSPPPM